MKQLQQTRFLLFFKQCKYNVNSDNEDNVDEVLNDSDTEFCVEEET